jgi:hypothetical protein
MLATMIVVRVAGAQDSARVPRPIFVGAEAENYLRYLQTLGELPIHPWSIRGFSDADLTQLRRGSKERAWNGWPVAPSGKGSLPWGLEVLPVNAGLIYNSLIPYGMNDGAVWAGRGVTVVGSAGVTARYGPLRVTLAPTAFWAQNEPFGLMPVQDSAFSPYSDALNAAYVDRPQRFGDAAYGRVDPGQSGVRLEGFGTKVGFSWENRWWGPMSDFPYILGNNAGGFPHAFLGTSSPRNIRIGRASVLLLYGQLSQSPYSPVDSGDGRRFGSGIVATFQPRPFPGLEVGAARFFHARWPDGGPTSEYFTHLFETFIKARIGKVFAPSGNPDEKISGDNQLASVFGRWVFPRSGVELYAEFGREDHNWDTRDLIVELDHTASIGYGIRKAWRVGDAVRAVRFEAINHQESTLQRHRPQGGAYNHSFTPQGHTERGQLLGAAAAVGNGAAASFMYERLEGAKASRFSWSRLVAMDPHYGAFSQGATHVLLVERSTPVALGAIRYGLSAIADLNHDLTGADLLSLRFEFGWLQF